VQIWDLGPAGDAEWLNLPASVAAPAFNPPPESSSGRGARIEVSETPPGVLIGGAGLIRFPGTTESSYRHGFRPTTRVQFMPDGRRVVTSLRDGSGVTIWDLRTGREVRTIGPAMDGFRVFSFDVSPDGGSVAVGGWISASADYGGQVARLWDIVTGKELFTIPHYQDVNEVDFSPDGEHLVTASYLGTAKIVDRAGHVVRVLHRDDGDIFRARFSPDGLKVATVAISGNAEARVTIWDWARGNVARTMEVARTINNVYGLAFDPGGSRIAVSGSEGLAELRDVESGAIVAVLQGSGGATDIAFAPDGSRVAVANADGTVRLFGADTGAPQLVLPGPGCPTTTVAFSPDGTKLASASPCGGVRIWALDIDDLLEIARREVTRPLTDEECRQYLHVDRCPQS
jgi:dipeptidyl aminopeptidase/acylaminoacyl peptidase